MARDQMKAVQRYAELQAELKAYEEKVAERDALAKDLSNRFGIEPDALATFVEALVTVEPVKASTGGGGSSRRGGGKGSRNPEAIKKRRDKIVAALREMGEAAKPQIAEKSRQQISTVNADISALEREGVVKRGKRVTLPKGARGQAPYIWTLKP